MKNADASLGTPSASASSLDVADVAAAEMAASTSATAPKALMPFTMPARSKAAAARPISATEDVKAASLSCDRRSVLDSASVTAPGPILASSPSCCCFALRPEAVLGVPSCCAAATAASVAARFATSSSLALSAAPALASLQMPSCSSEPNPCIPSPLPSTAPVVVPCPDPVADLETSVVWGEGVGAPPPAPPCPSRLALSTSSRLACTEGGTQCFSAKAIRSARPCCARAATEAAP
mmetsp:Transcript_8587/g.21456  ORF Transcript_8587/g.21456 Transcript_8587/m.21456 type:complete len:237 (+) Transcript_8587:891-1601(+)